eukprot:1900091-Prymnesium_polylepis.1
MLCVPPLPLRFSLTQECLDGGCKRCGFVRLWSKGLREEIDETDEFWVREISWDTIKPGGDQTHGSTDNDLHHTVSGTLIDFRTPLRLCSATGCPTASTRSRRSGQECELEENLTPHKLKKDSENGAIIVKDQTQSEYWHTKYGTAGRA